MRGAGPTLAPRESALLRRRSRDRRALRCALLERRRVTVSVHSTRLTITIGTSPGRGDAYAARRARLRTRERHLDRLLRRGRGRVQRRLECASARTRAAPMIGTCSSSSMAWRTSAGRTHDEPRLLVTARCSRRDFCLAEPAAAQFTFTQPGKLVSGRAPVGRTTDLRARHALPDRERAGVSDSQVWGTEGRRARAVRSATRRTSRTRGRTTTARRARGHAALSGGTGHQGQTSAPRLRELEVLGGRRRERDHHQRRSYSST